MTSEPTSEPSASIQTIRLATIADIPAIKALEESADAAAHWSEAQYREALLFPKMRVIFVIEAGNRPLGFLVGAGVGNEWEIENLVVAQDWRRKGLAGKLLARLLEHAAQNGIHKLVLEVRESNASARRFYEKWAFVEAGRRGAYYRQPLEDAIIYSRNLA